MPRVSTKGTLASLAVVIFPEQNGRISVGAKLERLTPRLALDGPPLLVVLEDLIEAIACNTWLAVFVLSGRGRKGDGEGETLLNPAIIAPTDGVLCVIGVENNWPIGTSSSGATAWFSAITSVPMFLVFTSSTGEVPTTACTLGWRC